MKGILNMKKFLALLLSLTLVLTLFAGCGNNDVNNNNDVNFFNPFHKFSYKKTAIGKHPIAVYKFN